MTILRFVVLKCSLKTGIEPTRDILRHTSRRSVFITGLVTEDTDLLSSDNLLRALQLLVQGREVGRPNRRLVAG